MIWIDIKVIDGKMRKFGEILLRREQIIYDTFTVMHCACEFSDCLIIKEPPVHYTHIYSFAHIQEEFPEPVRTMIHWNTLQRNINIITILEKYMPIIFNVICFTSQGRAWGQIQSTQGWVWEGIIPLPYVREKNQVMN